MIAIEALRTKRILSILLGASMLLAATACAPLLPQGEVLMASGRWDDAVAFYLDAVQRNRSDPEARAGLLRALNEASISYQREGDARERAGQFDEAKALYERSLSYNAENAAARIGLNRITARAKALEAVRRGRALLEKGAPQGAVREAEIALELVPELPEAQAMLVEAKAALPKPGAGTPDGEVVALFPEKPVTLRFRDTDIKEVLEVFARVSGVNIVTDDAVGPKRITANFKDLPIREAFRLILAANRFFAKQLAPNTVVVVPDNPGKRQQYDDLFVKTFYLSNADAKVAVNLLRTILNTRQIYVNEKLNALVVRDTPEKLELARKLLEANDRGGAEVEIELEVLEVDRNRLQDLGIQFTSQLTATLTPPSAQSLRGLSFIGPTTLALNITNPALTLNLLKNQGSTKILAHPTIRVLDRSKARLLIGERRPFQISQLSSVPATAGAAGATPTLPTGAVTTTETRVEFRDVGLKLTLTPTISLDGGVTVEINFEISSVGAPIAGVSGGQLLPPVNTRNLDSFIRVRDGETRLLGGLFQDSESETVSKIPFLGDLPLLGRLFSDVRTDKTRTDVLVAITPRLVKTVERPGPDLERFFSGTAETFGPPTPLLPATLPPPVAPVRPPTPPGSPEGLPPTPPIPPRSSGDAEQRDVAAASVETPEEPASPGPESPPPPSSAGATPEAPKPSRRPSDLVPHGISLQVASFREPSRAQTYVEKLRRSGLSAFSAPAHVPGKGQWVRVFIGPFPSEAAAAAARQQLPKGRATAIKVYRFAYILESDSFLSPERAAAAAARVRGLGYAPLVSTENGPGGRPRFRVRVQGFATLDDTRAIAEQLQDEEARFQAVPM